jgi:hypothetical protein
LKLTSAEICYALPNHSELATVGPLRSELLLPFANGPPELQAVDIGFVCGMQSGAARRQKINEEWSSTPPKDQCRVEQHAAKRSMQSGAARRQTINAEWSSTPPND